MWAQYRQSGMQRQPAGFNGLAGGSVLASNAAMAVPYAMGMGCPWRTTKSVGTISDTSLAIFRDE
jgi:hypothetical protein